MKNPTELFVEQKVIDFGSTEYQQTVHLRDEVLRKPLGLSIYNDDLNQDADQHHLAIFYQGNLVACLVLKQEENGNMKMRQVAVNSTSQGQGIGSQLVKFAEDYSKSLGFKTMSCHARQNATPFYLKQGYQIQGEPFLEINIIHNYMKKEL